jgi:acetyl-CoA carboxylase biotin carboxyl carrier protein
MNLSAEDVREILRLLDAVDADELHLETERFTLTLRRGADGGWARREEVRSPPNLVPGARPSGEAAPAAGSPGGPSPPAGPAGMPPPAAARSSPGRTVPPPAEARPPSTGGAGLLEVRAPLPGTFYRAPRPGAPPFVDLGGGVEPDSVVGIVETMKLMNPVLAGVRGTVAEICLADAAAVEQDAVLLRIEPEPS